MIKFKKYIAEGGAYGHLSHPWDIDNFTFGDLKQIIINALSGNLEYAEEKTDAINIMISWKDGRIIGARSKSHLKNSGKDALSIQQMIEKFKGRPQEYSYGQAMRDMSSALSKLTEAQRNKIFNNGRSWVSMEVMMPGSAENIIKYGVTELRLHGILTYDDSGELTKQIDKESARILEGMLRQVNAEKQEKFHIRRLSQVKLPPVDSFKQKKNHYLGQLKSIMTTLGVSEKESLVDAKRKYFTKEIDKLGISIDPNKKSDLINRLTSGNTDIPILSIVSGLDKEAKDKIKILDKGSAEHTKELIKPIELLFLRVGIDVLSMMTDFMAINKDETVQKIKDNLDDVIAKIKSSGKPDLISKLEFELARLEAIGGTKKILPAEGITFFYKGELLKITGAFAPLNQIMSLRFRM